MKKTKLTDITSTDDRAWHRMRLEFVLPVGGHNSDPFMKFVGDVRKDATVDHSSFAGLDDTPDYVLVTILFNTDLGFDPSAIPHYIRLLARIREDGSDSESAVSPFPPPPPPKSQWQRILEGWPV